MNSRALLRALSLVCAFSVFGTQARAEADATTAVCGASPSSEMGKAFRELRLCALDQAGRLERSGENPESIATAAIATCGPIRNQIQGMAKACADVLEEPGMLQVPAEFERLTRERVVAAVVQLRAAKPR